MASTVTGILLTGVHGSRPSSGVTAGTLYSCTTHSLIYQTSDTGSTWTTWASLAGTAAGTLTTVKDEGSNLSTAVVSLDFVGAGVTATGTTAATVTIPGGINPGQANAYPTTFASDVINGSSATPFVDVAAFDTKEVLNSRILHLRTLGASKDQRVRVTLGTTKAAAFDFTTAIACHVFPWTSAFDTYFEVSLRTSADAVIAIARIYSIQVPAASAHFMNTIRVGTTAVAADAANNMDEIPISSGFTLRITRDGSNNLLWYLGVGTAPMALMPIVDGGLVPLTASSSGTVARVEYSIHTPSGPSSTSAADAYVDYLASV